MNIKHDLLKKPLELKKTHDYIAPNRQAKLTVVMIHGIASDSATYNNALKYLEGTTSMREVRFVTFDLLGSGKSYKSDKLNYDYQEQLMALDNSIKKLHITTPLILVGHSMGTFIVTRYASVHKKAVDKLILVSPPVYTEDNLKDPEFSKAIEGFKQVVSTKNREILHDKAFNNSMDKIVMDQKNYKTLAELKTPAVLIYGEGDQIVASFNYPKLIKTNPKYLSVIKTDGRHGVSHDKYIKILTVLEETLNA